MDHVSQKQNAQLPSRAQMIAQLKSEQFDVLIIGGGATGAGAAVEAASRGLKTALIERSDFSSGTSSRSTKLIHGGVRYLENAFKRLDWREYALVRDALKERRRFLNNAPHLTAPLPIITPVYGWFEAAYYLVGLKIYDLISGSASLGASTFLSKSETLKRFPMVKKAGLKGAVIYYDGQFDDARMNITLILSAIREGAAALNYVRAEQLIKDAGKITGASVVDQDSQERFNVKAKVILNATGTFADSIRIMDDKNAQPIMEPSQGSHVLLAQKFSSPNTGLIIPKTKDDRVIFLLPWLGKTLCGTTDQAQKITSMPKATDQEVEYILEHLRQYADVPVNRSDVLASWSGLRPLAKPSAGAKSTASISRDHLIDVSPSNLVTVVGGKWTTYRKMGEEAIETAIKVAKLEPQRDSVTSDLKLAGGELYKESLAADLVAREGLLSDVAVHLSKSYGDRALAVIELGGKSLRGRLVAGFPNIDAEIVYATKFEYALSAVDVISRRMRLAFLDNEASRAALPKVIALMADNLGWDQKRINKEREQAEAFLDTMLTRPQL